MYTYEKTLSLINFILESSEIRNKQQIDREQLTKFAI